LTMNQTAAPLYDAVCRNLGKAAARFHVPGHRQGAQLPEELTKPGGRALFELDLTELPGLDDLHHPAGAIREAERLAAGAFGARRTFFLVNGSTAGIHALLAAVGPKKVLVPRSAHRSIIGGLILAGADPVYAWSATVPGFEIPAGPSFEGWSERLAEYPDAAAVITVSPSYHGVAGNMTGLAGLCHARGIPLLVDEAHGAHLRFHPDLPLDAMGAGADAAVHSTHKFGGSLTQSSMLHLGSAGVSERAVAAALNLLQTTSPSYPLMLSLDLARRQLALEGKALLQRALEMARDLKKGLERIQGVVVLSAGHLPAGCALDGTKLVVSVRGLGLTGYQAAALLHERYGIFVEMADPFNLVLCVTIGTTREDCAALVPALQDLARREGRAPDKTAGLPIMPRGVKKVMPPREAWFSRSRAVPLVETRGLACAETVAVFPPGIPVLCPGEEVTGEVLEYLLSVRRLGLSCHGPADPELNLLRVVVE
jgi:arginine decarboxylase